MSVDTTEARAALRNLNPEAPNADLDPIRDWIRRKHPSPAVFADAMRFMNALDAMGPIGSQARMEAHRQMEALKEGVRNAKDRESFDAARERMRAYAWKITGVEPAPIERSAQ